jgi:hypothetical protein
LTPIVDRSFTLGAPVWGLTCLVMALGGLASYGVRRANYPEALAGWNRVRMDKFGVFVVDPATLYPEPPSGMAYSAWILVTGSLAALCFARVLMSRRKRRSP